MLFSQIKVASDRHVLINRDPETRCSMIIWRRLVPVSLIPSIMKEKNGKILKVYKGKALWENTVCLTDDAIIGLFKLFSVTVSRQEVKLEESATK